MLDDFVESRNLFRLKIVHGFGKEQFAGIFFEKKVDIRKKENYEKSTNSWSLTQSMLRFC